VPGEIQRQDAKKSFRHKAHFFKQQKAADDVRLRLFKKENAFWVRCVRLANRETVCVI